MGLCVVSDTDIDVNVTHANAKPSRGTIARYRSTLTTRYAHMSHDRYIDHLRRCSTCHESPSQREHSQYLEEKHHSGKRTANGHSPAMNNTLETL